MIGFTHPQNSNLMFRVEPNHDGDAVVVGAHSLAAAIAEADRLRPLLTQPTKGNA